MVLSIKNMDWEELKQKILNQKSLFNKKGDEHKESSLGKVSDLTPSGEHRNFGRPSIDLFFTGSYKGYMKVTDIRSMSKAEHEDSDWWTELIEEAKKHEIYIRPSSDKNRTYIMAGIKIKDRLET